MLSKKVRFPYSYLNIKVEIDTTNDYDRGQMRSCLCWKRSSIVCKQQSYQNSSAFVIERGVLADQITDMGNEMNVRRSKFVNFGLNLNKYD